MSLVKHGKISRQILVSTGVESSGQGRKVGNILCLVNSEEFAFFIRQLRRKLDGRGNRIQGHSARLAHIGAGCHRIFCLVPRQSVQGHLKMWY